MRPGLTLKEECEARMRRSNTHESSRRRHLRSRHRSSSSSSSGSRRRHRSRSSSSSSYDSRSRRRSKHKRSHNRSDSDGSLDRTDRFGRRLNPSNVTNSKDPKAVASRVFLGSLTPDLTREDVDAKLSKYGKILGITLLQGYGFVQFSEEEEALRAVESEKDGTLKGQRFDIRLASERKKRYSQEDGHHRKRSRDPDYPRPPYPYDDPYRRGLPPPPHVDPYHRGGPLPPIDPFLRGPPPPPHLDPYRGHVPPPYHRGPPHPGDPYARGPPYDPYVRGPPPPGDPFRRPSYPDPLPYPGPPLPPPPASVDCEIVVLDDKQRGYADGIKKRLMSAGIITELNVLPPGMDAITALEEATRRRLLFAIIVNDQNEIHRSITVNILHGLTQEHRNMPMDDAITLVTRSFDKYMLEKQDRMSKDERPPPEDSGTKRAPEFLRPTANTLYLLNLLADNRFLTIDELDTVVDYLQLRRDRQVKSQGGPSAGSRMVGPTTPPPIKQGHLDNIASSSVSMRPPEPDLHSILGLLQSEKTASMEAAKPVASYTTPSLSASSSVLSTSINFNNPTVQQALDNLIMSGPGFLKSLTDASKAAGSVTPAASKTYEEKSFADQYADWDTDYRSGAPYRGGNY